MKKKGEIVIPKGATVAGRITRLEKYENYSLVGIEFPEIEAPGMVAHMKGRLDHIVGVFPSAHADMQSRGTTPALPGEGVFPVNETQLRLLKGCIMFWRT